jgi:hypothetical protein
LLVPHASIPTMQGGNLVRPSKRLANNDLAIRINAVELKNALGQVEAW